MFGFTIIFDKCYIFIDLLNRVLQVNNRVSISISIVKSCRLWTHGRSRFRMRCRILISTQLLIKVIDIVLLYYSGGRLLRSKEWRVLFRVFYWNKILLQVHVWIYSSCVYEVYWLLRRLRLSLLLISHKGLYFSRLSLRSSYFSNFCYPVTFKMALNARQWQTLAFILVMAEYLSLASCYHWAFFTKPHMV